MDLHAPGRASRRRPASRVARDVLDAPDLGLHPRHRLAAEILSAAAVKLLAAPIIVWCAAKLVYSPVGEAQYAAVVEGTTPAMVTTLLLADRFKLDSGAAALLIGWTTILFWLTLPAIMALGLIR